MSQEKTGSTGGTGTICAKTGLYKATDGRVEAVQYIEAGKAFPFFPGGEGKTKCSWSALSRSTDGSKTGFTSVKVAAGSA